MRLRALFVSLICFCIAACAVHPVLAREQTAALSCGATAEEAVAVAEKALGQKRDPDSQAAALTCVIEAVKRLAAEQPVALRGDNRHPMLHAPMQPGGPGKP